MSKSVVNAFNLCNLVQNHALYPYCRAVFTSAYSDSNLTLMLLKTINCANMAEFRPEQPEIIAIILAGFRSKNTVDSSKFEADNQV
jgi:hypothetical protein